MGALMPRIQKGPTLSAAAALRNLLHDCARGRLCGSPARFYSLEGKGGGWVGWGNDTKATMMRMYFSNSPLFLVSAVNGEGLGSLE